MDPMGLKSGGRSAGNSTGRGARRRASRREREAIEPPQDLLQPFEENVSERLQRASQRGWWLGYAGGFLTATGLAVLIRVIAG